jgi:hypothetical protein
MGSVGDSMMGLSNKTMNYGETGCSAFVEHEGRYVEEGRDISATHHQYMPYYASVGIWGGMQLCVARHSSTKPKGCDTLEVITSRHRPQLLVSSIFVLSLHRTNTCWCR